MNTKGKRAANWESKDKVLLKEITKPYLGLLNDKSLQSSTNEAKNKAWVEIAKKFNSICSERQRTAKQLRVQWKTMKILKKRQMMEAGKIDDSKLEIATSETQDTSDNMLDFQCLKVESIDYNTDSGEETNPLEDSNTASETFISAKPIKKQSSNIQVEYEVLSACNESSTQTDHDYTTSHIKKGHTSSFSEKHYEDMRYYRDMENNRLEKEHLLRMRTMQDQHNQLMKNLRLQEEILKKQLSKLD